MCLCGLPRQSHSLLHWHGRLPYSFGVCSGTCDWKDQNTYSLNLSLSCVAHCLLGFVVECAMLGYPKFVVRKLSCYTCVLISSQMFIDTPQQACIVWVTFYGCGFKKLPWDSLRVCFHNHCGSVSPRKKQVIVDLFSSD